MSCLHLHVLFTFTCASVSGKTKRDNKIANINPSLPRRNCNCPLKIDLYPREHNLKMLTIALLFQLFCACLAASIATQKCPSLESNQQLQQLRRKCVPFENFTVPQSISPATEPQLLCVLYLANYDAACGKNLQVPATTAIQNFSAVNVCTNLRWVFEGAKSLISNEILCRGLCVDWKKGGVVDECNAAFYLDGLLAHAAIVDAKTSEPSKNKQNDDVEKPHQKTETAPKETEAHGKTLL